MADALTPLLQLLQMETGSHNNDWGNLLNQVLGKVDTAIAGMSTITVTGGTYAITDDEARPAMLVITGTLTSASIVEVQARTKAWKVVNLTTGAFPVSIKPVGGTAYTVGRGKPLDLFTDGSSFFETGPGQIPVGGTMHYMGTAIPDNFIEMGGQAVSRTQYPALFTAIGTTWGTGDGSTTFNVPNAKDRYLRGRSDTFGLGYLTQDIQSHAHTAASDTQGSHGHTSTVATGGNHNHSYTRTNFTGGLGVSAGGWTLGTGSSTVNTGNDGNHTHTVTIDASGSHSHTITVGATGGTETRPNSIIGIACIRYQ